MKKKELTIRGKSYPCRVTMGAMVRYKRASGQDVSKMSQEMSDLLLFMWCCVASASKADGIDFDLSFDDFADLLEPQDLQGFIETMQEQNAEKKTSTQK